jgi:N-methylhydantoinase A
MTGLAETGRAEIGVDIGGTFTDVVLLQDHRRLTHTKVPSTPRDPIRGVVHGIEQVLAMARLSPAQVTRVAHGSTVAINALLERNGARLGILMTSGFEDTLEIGRQKRSRMYDVMLRPETPVFLAPRHRRLGVTERIAADGSIVTPLDEDALRMTVETLVRGHAVTAIAVCYLFSFRNPKHERRTRAVIAEAFPDVQVSLSSDVDPTFREYERLVVTALDAYLQQTIGDYVGRLGDALRQTGVRGELQVMQSRGGLTRAASVDRRPVSMLLSGLAAGAVGSRFAASAAGQGRAISLDIGGTSCDIALIRAGRPVLTGQAVIAGLPLRAQMVDVSTIGAGGGSIAWIDGAGGLRVGPRSAGADPGPACYGQGGMEATVTDASLVLGYLDPDAFAGGTMRLDRDAAEAAVDRLAIRLGLDRVATAAGIHRIINARMADEVRRVAVQRGYDPREFVLLPLGGAGPLHAAAVAAELGMARVVVPHAPGVLSAFGLLVADIEHDQAETFAARADEVDGGALAAALARLNARGREKMQADDVPPDAVAIEVQADMRYVGQSYELSVVLADGAAIVPQAVEGFHAAHERAYGHANRDAAVEFVNLRTIHLHRLEQPRPDATAASGTEPPAARSRDAWFAGCGFVPVRVYARSELSVGVTLGGPAIIEQPDTTTILHPGQSARVDEGGNLVMETVQHG